VGRKKDELPTGQAREWLETGGLSSRGATSRYHEPNGLSWARGHDHLILSRLGVPHASSLLKYGTLPVQPSGPPVLRAGQHSMLPKPRGQTQTRPCPIRLCVSARVSHHLKTTAVTGSDLTRRRIQPGKKSVLLGRRRRARVLLGE
jgi:hypothetical protein